MPVNNARNANKASIDCVSVPWPQCQLHPGSTSASRSANAVLTAWCRAQSIPHADELATDLPDFSLEIEAADYPWKVVAATHNFSGVLDPRPKAAIPCWTTRPAVLKAIQAALVSPEGETMRREEGRRKDGKGGGIAVEAVMAVADDDCRTADSSTGRNIMTSHETVARRVTARGFRMSVGTVRKARRVLRTLGFQATVEQGRYLTKTERLEYALTHPKKEGHNGKQYVPWRKASTRVFTMAADVVRGTGHLPRRGLLTPNLKKVSTSQKRLRAVSKSSTPTKPRSARPQSAGPRPLGIQKLAARLKQRYGWLSGIRHNNTICDVLTRHGVDPDRWTVNSLVNALNQRSKERGMRTPKRITNPAGYLNHILSDLNPVAAAAIHYRESRATAATAASSEAKAKLDWQASEEHRQQLLANAAMLRAALRGTAQKESS